ncbi:MAG: carboxymuconolactone decarboxylase family protein [Mariprofundus sp.]|nr:carboxymuconolactone decarboxylase family protein [Mariprofundus sp.]
MGESYLQLTKDLSGGIAELGSAIPDVMKGFSSLAQAASRDGALDKKTKELIALSIGVAGHCKGCIGFHSKTLVDMGVTKEELSEALGIAIYMGGGPSLMYAAEAMQAFHEFSQKKDAMI